MSSHDCCDKTTLHPSHKGQTSRLNRIAGQINGVKTMIVEERYCPEILTQLRAVRSAIKSLEADMLRTHLNHCVTNDLSGKDPAKKEKTIEELVQLFKTFEPS